MSDLKKKSITSFRIGQNNTNLVEFAKSEFNKKIRKSNAQSSLDLWRKHVPFFFEQRCAINYHVEKLFSCTLLSH